MIRDNNDFCNFNRVEGKRLPEDYGDASKHIGVLKVYRIHIGIYIYLFIYMLCIFWSGQYIVASRFTLCTSKHYNVLFQTWGAIIVAYAILETAFVNEAKPGTGVLEWFESFGEGHEYLHNGPSSGQLSTDRNPTIVSKLHELVDTDRQINLKLGLGETCTLPGRRCVSALVKI